MELNSGQNTCKTEIETVFGHCRCCLEEGHHRDDLSKLFLTDGEQENYYDIFQRCLNLFLSTNSNLSTLICKSCVYKLREAQEFRSLVMRTDRQLVKVEHQLWKVEHQLTKTSQICGDEQPVPTVAPVAEATLDTGFRAEVNDDEDNTIFKAEFNDEDDTGFKAEVNDNEDFIPHNLADLKFEVGDDLIEDVEVDRSVLPLLSGSDVVSVPSPAQKKRRRRNQPKESMSDLKQKCLTNLDTKYVIRNGIVVDEKIMGRACLIPTCPFKCLDNISHLQRLHCFRKFWNLSSGKKNSFLVKFVRKLTKHPFKYEYHLPVPTLFDSSVSKRVAVCKHMFLSTLAISDRLIYTAHEKLKAVIR